MQFIKFTEKKWQFIVKRLKKHLMFFFQFEKYFPSIRYYIEIYFKFAETIVKIITFKSPLFFRIDEKNIYIIAWTSTIQWLHA